MPVVIKGLWRCHAALGMLPYSEVLPLFSSLVLISHGTLGPCKDKKNKRTHAHTKNTALSKELNEISALHVIMWVDALTVSLDPFRCPVGKFWHFNGERCAELVSVPLDPFLFLACLAGALTFVFAVIALLISMYRKCVRTRKTLALV